MYYNLNSSSTDYFLTRHTLNTGKHWLGLGLGYPNPNSNPSQHKSVSYGCTDIVIIQVGTNLVNIAVGKKTDVTLRELGGNIAPIWSTYYKDSPAIMVGK